MNIGGVNIGDIEEQLPHQIGISNIGGAQVETEHYTR